MPDNPDLNNQNSRQPLPELASEIVGFWRGAGRELWFSKNDEFDETVKQRYGDLPDKAMADAFVTWRDHPTSALALILILDQFPRNIFRASANAFAYDQKAIDEASIAIERRHDAAFTLPLKRFYYIPYMHAEELGHQQRCLDLCNDAEDEEGVKFAQIHYDIIKRFGRFPHRNEVLGRKTTDEERRFLEDGGFAG